MFCAVLLAVVGLPVSCLIRQAPEPYGYLPDGVARTPPEPGKADTMVSAADAGFPAREVLRIPSFWLLASGHSAALMSVSALSAHLIPFLIQDISMSLEAAATVVATITACTFTAQLLGGFLGDRLSKRAVAATCMVGHTLGLLVLMVATTPATVYVAAILHGVSWGVRGPLMMPLRAEYFGRRALATIEGFVALVTTAGLTIGPLMVGVVADNLGDYRIAFGVLAVGTAGGGLCFAFAAPPKARSAIA